MVKRRLLTLTVLFEGVFANQQSKSTVFAKSNKATTFVDVVATMTAFFSCANLM